MTIPGAPRPTPEPHDLCQCFLTLPDIPMLPDRCKYSQTLANASSMPLPMLPDPCQLSQILPMLPDPLPMLPDPCHYFRIIAIENMVETVKFFCKDIWNSRSIKLFCVILKEIMLMIKNPLHRMAEHLIRAKYKLFQKCLSIGITTGPHLVLRQVKKVFFRRRHLQGDQQGRVRLSLHLRRKGLQRMYKVSQTYPPTLTCRRRMGKHTLS